VNDLFNRRQASAVIAASAAAPLLHAAPATGVKHVPWSRQAAIYEVNLRQFTPEGTLRAFEAHLPRLRKLGVGIVWLMPLQPIGVKNRKGTLGSYYAIRDYTAVNPEFGTLDDLKRVVRRAHALGMKVILDWVANHTAWDHAWTTEHPERYKKNAQGEIYPVTFTPESGPVERWDDVVGLDYNDRGLWDAMAQAMLLWLREADLDGFRCDVAGLVPTPFWEHLRPRLDAVKPVFMLAESDKPELHAKAFDMTYDWALYDTLRSIAQGKAGAADLRAWWTKRQDKYPTDAIGMNFTGNHDSNSWAGSDAEFYGSPAAFKAMAVLAATLPGMPLIYGGQESYFEKRLQFFEKDPIVWGDYSLAGFYSRLLALKKRHPALANGPGGSLQIEDGGNDAVFSFTRRSGGRRLRVTVNMSGESQAIAGGDSLAAWAWRIAA
jgi:glycosidase